jgi:hypothetical protein
MKSVNMRTELLKRKARKTNELMDMYSHRDVIDTRIAAAEAVVAEIDSLLKLAPEEEGSQSGAVQPELRPNSLVAKARDTLRKLRKATHIDELLKTMELSPDKKRSLGSQLAWYARREQIFTRPEAGTFGLVEWGPKMKTYVVMEPENELEPLPALSLEDDEGDEAH